MHTISYNELCSLECTVTNISAFHSVWKDSDSFDYETFGRSKNLLYYQCKGTRNYYKDGKLLFVLRPSDVLFIPDRFRYATTTHLTSTNESSVGIGISFNLLDPSGDTIIIDEPLRIVEHDNSDSLLASFQSILFSVLHPAIGLLRAQGKLLLLLDRFFAQNHIEGKIPEDIRPAIEAIEQKPENNLNNQELATLCFMSEASFVRRFKQYTGGLPPLQYRNNIRLMRAEELVNTGRTIEEIALSLGFYDAAHLCRIYKKYRGYTLKRQRKT